MAREAARQRAVANVDSCYLCHADPAAARLRVPGGDIYGHPELGNRTLAVKPGDSMLIADRMVFRGRLRLDPGRCVVMDEFGGDFSCDAYAGDAGDLVIPIGHKRQDIWPAKMALRKVFRLGTDTGSLAFLSSSDVRSALRQACVAWDCGEGTYDFFYEEVAVLGPFKQAAARNIIVLRRGGAPSPPTRRWWWPLGA